MSSRWLLSVALLPLLLASPALGDIVINEIMQNPGAVSDSVGEWFELFNSGTESVDINNWTILDNDLDSHTIENGGPLLIDPGGYLVLGRNADPTSNGGVLVDYQYDLISLANAADELVLRDPLLVEQDRVEWDDGMTFPDPVGASMELVDPSLDNGNGLNWEESLVPFGLGDFGTPGSVNSVPEPDSTVLVVASLLTIGLLRCLLSRSILTGNLKPQLLGFHR